MPSASQRMIGRSATGGASRLGARFLAVLLAAIVPFAAMPGVAFAVGDPMLARQLTDRGIALQQKNDHVAALSLFEAALVETDHPKIRYFRAKSLKSLDRLDESIAEFEAILDREEVSKYRSEIMSFINEMKGDKERDKLAQKLEAERQARAKAEAERRAAERKADESAISLLRQKRSGLLPATELRMQDGPTVARIVPLVPIMWEPTTDYEGRLEVMQVVSGIERYETELTAAKVLTVLAVIGVSVGVGVGLNPLADREVGQSAQQAGLAIGVVGVVSGLAAMALWPSEPVDPRATVVGAAAR